LGPEARLDSALTRNRKFERTAGLLPYRIEYSPEVEHHLRVLTGRQRKAVLDAVERQLVHQPTVETKNRKPMRPNPIAPWELRIGSLRVYYDVEEKPEFTVAIRAVGVKERDRLRIGKEVIQL
jgi:mRNA-degrading endonuclease RelE of RelBE toxin-antitoxin system